MKYLIIIIFSILQLNMTVITDECNYSYPQLDQALIGLWHSSKINDHNGAKQSLSVVDREWNVIVPDLYKYLNPFIDLTEFNKDMDYLLISMKIALYEEDYIDLGDYALKLLYQFKSLRAYDKNIEAGSYPLDNLLEMIDVYKEINYTVHDQMFGLKYWFEFEDLVLGFQKEWKAYDSMGISQINNCFPHIEQVEHQILKEKVEECLSYFLDSLKSGYRTDFQIPCDELGGALTDLLLVYSNNGDTGISLKN